LSTNLNEGCLCSFSRQGLIMARPQPGHTYSIDRIHVGLAKSETYDRIEVQWPGGAREQFPGGKADRVVTLTEGQGTGIAPRAVGRGM